VQIIHLAERILQKKIESKTGATAMALSFQSASLEKTVKKLNQTPQDGLC
jgi:hypothetical protein